MGKVLLLETPSKNVQHYETNTLLWGRRSAIIEESSWLPGPHNVDWVSDGVASINLHHSPSSEKMTLYLKPENWHNNNT